MARFGDGWRYGDGTRYGETSPTGGGEGGGGGTGSGGAIQTGFAGLYYAWPTSWTQYVTEWNLQSPDGTIWTFTISTTGIVTITSGTGTASTVPVFRGGAPATIWTPTIDNNGIVTLTSGADVGGSIASLLDSSGIQWEFLVTDADNTQVQNARSTSAKRHRIAVSVKHSGSQFVIHRAQLIVNLSQRVASLGYIALTATGTSSGASQTLRQIAISVKHSGSDFRIYAAQLEANLRRRLLAG